MFIATDGPCTVTMWDFRLLFLAKARAQWVQW